MADDLGRGDAAHGARHLQALPGGIAIKEPRRELVARPGRIDRHDAMHRHLDPLRAADQHHVGARAGADHQPAVRGGLRQRRLEIGLIERFPLVLIADDVIHLLRHQTAEACAVTVDAERVRQRDPRLAAAAVAALRGLQERRLAVVLVEEIALEEQDLGVFHHLERHVLGRDLGRDAEIGVHRALAIRGDEDHRARGRQLGRGNRRVRKARALAVQRRLVEAAKCIVAHPPDEGGVEAEIAEPGDGVADRAARRLRALAHRGIEHLGALALDQLHDALLDAHQLEEAVVALRDDIDDGVADADNLILLHAVFSSKAHRSRIRQSAQRGLRAVQM
ncbi:hypothetical protein SDC9_19953 [bioreactor metagenome]|uniref:Uncharacterized protein n=1 Tax=bioreactor metagenome TaxID=1076179 RepID=A0A644U5H5_9ZZZZ